MQIGIQINNVKKKLGTTQALGGLSAHLAPGRLHGLIGPDGAGKTTLIRTLMGLLYPDEGDIVFTREGMVVPFAEVRPSMAYQPQQQSLYADLSIEEHLEFFRDLYQIPDDDYQAKKDDLLHVTRLDKFRDRPAGKLSGGMYKKLGLMCALLQSPSVLLLDEPTNGVDPISRREFWDLLYRLKQDKILILISTAYMDEAERCDEVHILNEGRLLGEGEPRALLERENIHSFDELFSKKVEASV